MRILVVTDNRFWRRQIGSQRRIASLCDHLAKRGHLVSILFGGFLYPVDQNALNHVDMPHRIHCLGHRGSSSTDQGPAKSSGLGWREWVRRLYFQVRADLGRFRGNAANDGVRKKRLQLKEPKLFEFIDQRVVDRFNQLCKLEQPDLIIVEYVRLAYLLRAGRASIPGHCVTMIDTHDVQYDRQSRFHAKGQVHDIDITAQEEALALSGADYMIAIQSKDAARLKALCPSGAVLVVGFPETLFEHAPSDVLRGTVRIGFFGSNMAPNVDAAKVLVEDVLPRLRQRFADKVELHLFGAVCSSIEPVPNAQGLLIHGFVDDLYAAYDLIDIVANPIAFGGGLNIKNVEALCHGRALVTTTLGAEGLEEAISSGFIVADGLESFVSELAALIQHADVRTRLAAKGFDFARSKLGEDSVYSDLDALIERRTSERSIGEKLPNFAKDSLDS